MRGNQITLKKMDEEGEANAYFTLELKDNQLVGTWEDKTKKKKLVLEAKLFSLK